MKKTTFRKTLSILLSVIMLVATCAISFGVSVSAEDETTAYVGLTATDSGSWGSNITWSYYAGIQTLVFSGNGEMDAYATYYTDNNGTSIPWKTYASVVTTAIFEDGITSTCNYVLRGFTALTSVSIPTSLTTLGAHFVFGCDDLTSIIIPEGVTTIGTAAFRDCDDLEVISLPASLISLAANQTIACGSLVLVAYAGSDWSATNYAGNTAGASYPDFIDSNVTTGDTSDDNVVTSLSLNTEYAIADSELTWSLSEDLTITISGTGEMPAYTDGTQPWYALKTAIKSVVIEEGVTTIGTNAFYQFTNITSLSIATTVTDIYNTAFHSTGLTSVAFPEGVVNIWNGAFRYCYSIDTIYISSTVETINANAFGGVTNDGSFTAVYYQGTEAEYDLINISSSSNPGLYDKSTTIYYSHVCSSVTVLEKISSSCTAAGTIVYECNDCGRVYTEETDSAVGHTEVLDDSKNFAATCSATGWGGATVCEVCGVTINEGAATSKLAHTWSYDDEYVVDLEATCTNEGSMSIHCSVCDVIIEDTKTAIATNGSHVFEEGTYSVITESNCTVAGTATGFCTECGKYDDDGNKIYITIELELDPDNHIDEDGSGRCDNCSADMSIVDYDSLSFIDKIMLWINELIAAIQALFSSF